MPKKFYIPEGIGRDYKYVVPSNDYYDVYNTNYLNNNSDYTYYRFYYDLDEDLYTTNVRSTSNYNYGWLNCIEVDSSSEYIYRRDYKDIVSTAFILTIGFVLLINIITSCFRKGGVLSGLI